MYTRPEYGTFVHVLLTNLTEHDQTAPSMDVWRAMEREVRVFEHTEFTGYADSWLRAFVAFVATRQLDLNSDNFVFILRTMFLTQPSYAVYANDVHFDVTGMRVTSVRVPVLTR